MVKLIPVYSGPKACVQVCEEISPGIYRPIDTLYGDNWEVLRAYFKTKKYFSEVIADIPTSMEY